MAKKTKDAGHDETENVLAEIEKRIAKEYSQAEEEVAEKLDKYMKSFEAKDKKKQKDLKAGLISQSEYDQWKVGQIAMGRRWEELRQNLAEDFTHADQIARSITGDYMPEVYAINHNYGTYQIEKDTRINTNYTLYDAQTVERLADVNDDIIPVPGKKLSKAIKEGKAVRWNNQQIQSVMMQSILQGESIPNIAKRLSREVGEKDRKAAVRNARTLTTGVQNRGRVDSYKRAQKLGIDLEQQWVATLDGRTRHEHRLLDGQAAPVGGKFKVEGYEIEYPGDPTAPGHLIYNCRCTLIPSIKGWEFDLSDRSLRYDDKLGDMSYEEWKYGLEKKKIASDEPENDESYGLRDKIFNKFDGVDKKVKTFRKGLEEVYNEDIKKALTDADKQVVYKKSVNKKTEILYTKDRVIICLGPDTDTSTIAHELFHYIDFKNKITEKGALTTSIVGDYNKLSKKGDISKYLANKYPEAFRKNGLVKRKYRGVSDIINGCSSGQINLGYGHNDKDYWTDKTVEEETLAQLGRIFYANDKEVIRLMEAEFPGITQEFLSLVRRL